MINFDEPEIASALEFFGRLCHPRLETEKRRLGESFKSTLNDMAQICVDYLHRRTSVSAPARTRLENMLSAMPMQDYDELAASCQRLLIDIGLGSHADAGNVLTCSLGYRDPDKLRSEPRLGTCSGTDVLKLI